MPRVVLVLVAVGAMVVTACSGDEESVSTSSPTTEPSASSVTAPPPPVRTVAVIGDSITVGAEDEIRDALADIGADVVAIDAESGRRITQAHAVDAGIDAVERVRRLAPDLWVVALGTNDVFSLEDPAAAGALIDELLAGIPAAAAVVWVTVYVEDAAATSAGVNMVLHERINGRDRAGIADWFGVVADSELLDDGVHPTAAGDVAFAGVIARAVEPWLETTTTGG